MSRPGCRHQYLWSSPGRGGSDAGQVQPMKVSNLWLVAVQPRARTAASVIGPTRRWTPERDATRCLVDIHTVLRASNVGLAKQRTTHAQPSEPSRVPRSDSGQKMILWAFYRQGSNFEALVQPLRASARAGDRPGHTILIKYLCPTEPGSAATSPVLRSRVRETITRQNSNYRRPPDRFAAPGRFGQIQRPGQAGAHS